MRRGMDGERREGQKERQKEREGDPFFIFFLLEFIVQSFGW